MKKVIIILLILIFFWYSFTIKEKFNSSETIIPSNLFEDMSIELNRSIIIKMNDMIKFINDSSEYEPEIYRNLPASYKNRQTYIQILYEVYVIDFLDKYIVNRFNAHKLLNLTYKYPSYENVNDKYPKDEVENDYDRIFKEFLEPSIKNIFNNKDNNLNNEYFKFTVNNINIDDLKNLKQKLDDLNPNKFTEFYEKNIMTYLVEVLSKLNIIHNNNCNDTELFPFVYTFKEIKDDNTSEILELVDDILENELRYY